MAHPMFVTSCPQLSPLTGHSPCPQVVLSERQKELALALRSTGLLMKAIPAQGAQGGLLLLCSGFWCSLG